ncbi:dienelactone hydrolase family protein [Candidatus Sumerlaeota bacterium]|nr:dienelactone hydrolase family protein [Candidatus Sumerlaeota bacterium]
MNLTRPLMGALLAALAVSACAQDLVLERLEQSPRHHEWIDVASGERTVRCFVAYPEVDQPASAVLVIHENRGLTDWVRGVADRLAEAGHIAIAPDLLSGMGPEGGNTAAFASQDAATQAIYALDPDQVTADLRAVADHVIALPACNGTLSVAGFCWGGGQSLRFATNRADLQAAFVFYGSTELTAEDAERIACPIHGFYGGNDARVTSTVPATAALLEAAGKVLEPVIHEGAGHAFMRTGEAPDASDANREARDRAWERWLTVLGE